MKTLLTLTALLTLGALAATPTAQASDPLLPLFDNTPDFQCMDVYSQTYLGNGYWLVRRDSCSAQLYQCPEGYSPPAPPCQEASLLEASASASTLSCYLVYTRTDVGTYSIVRRTSCSPPEVYSCPYEGAPIDQCSGVLELRSAAVSSEFPWPGGQTPDVQCMDVYSETHLVGPYWLVRRDSCSAELYECPEGYSPPAPPCQHASLLTASALPSVGLPPVYCMPYTREFTAGPLTVEQGGCGNDVELCDDSVLDREVKTHCITTVAMQSSAQEPMCMYYYHETEVGPVRHVQRDSCHSETYVCDETAREFASVDLTNPDHAKLQDCVRDTLDDYVAWG
jgi:hypothetical protein